MSIFSALARNGSFAKLGFGVGLCGFANVPFVQWKNFKFFCAVGKKIKHEGSGNECRLTRCPFVVSFLCPCSLVKMVYFFSVFSRLFMVALSSFRLTANVEGLLLCRYLKFVSLATEAD
ncbi:MAG: hypothetical protein J0H76_14625 [Sphingobacteriales bacterium]|nr:hypothetical protein [Sphingobacteriales bacterium]